MSQNFDEYSKHLAAQPSRRGLLKFLAGGVIGAFAGTLLMRGNAADASPHGATTHKLPRSRVRVSFNSTLPDK